MKKSWIRRQFRTFERLYRWWSFRFTAGGKAISLLGLYLIPAILSFDDAKPFVGICAFSVLLLTWLLARVFRPKLEVDVRLPAFATEGQPFIATAEVCNPTQQAALDLVVRLKPERERKGHETWLVDQKLQAFSLNEQEATVRRLQVTSTKRGLRRAPAVQVLTLFPMNLLRKPVMLKAGREVVVLPKVLPVRVNGHESVSRMLGIEQRLLATAGSGFEYLGSREYREGPVRRWDYASWARTGQPVVREFAEEADRQISVVIDTTMQGRATRNAETFEAHIANSFSLVEHLLNEEVEVALCVVGEAVIDETARPGNQGHQAIRKTIASAELSNKPSAATVTPNVLPRLSDGPVLLFLAEWSEQTDALVKQFQRRRDAEVVVVLSADVSDLPPGIDAIKLRAHDGGLEVL